MTESPRDRQGWTKVARAQNESEALFIQGLLREEGVASILRRTRGSDVPELLAAGPRDVLVAASRADIARDVLLQGQPGQLVQPPRPIAATPHRLVTKLLVAVAILAIIAWCTTELFV
jgi:hypothetical protein